MLRKWFYILSICITKKPKRKCFFATLPHWQLFGRPVCRLVARSTYPTCIYVCHLARSAVSIKLSVGWLLLLFVVVVVHMKSKFYNKFPFWRQTPIQKKKRWKNAVYVVKLCHKSKPSSCTHTHTTSSTTSVDVGSKLVPASAPATEPVPKPIIIAVSKLPSSNQQQHK